MKRGTIRRVLQMLFAAIALCCAAALIWIGLRYIMAARMHKQAQEMFIKPSVAAPEKTEEQAAETEAKPAPAPVAPDVDFDALEAESADAVGWLWIGGTDISYPVVQAQDNEKYLDTAYNGKRSVSGSIFMDSRNAVQLTDDNTVIYGHNMKDRSMFGSLKNYRQQEFADAHRAVYLLTRAGKLHYEVFAVYEVAANDPCYQRTFENEDARNTAIEQAYARSEIATPGAQVERYLTLSTCTASDAHRLVVQAYYVGAE